MAVCVFIQDEFIGTRTEPDTKGVLMSNNTVDSALVVSDVTKKFGKDKGPARRWPWQKPADPADDKEQKQIMAVDHITMSVQHKEIFGILGANGSGKSTLIRLVSTLLVPDTGNVAKKWRSSVSSIASRSMQPSSRSSRPWKT
jgi:ABC-2 type transport system ATP-binding protein